MAPTSVLVTGGAGYIGSHTAKLLRRDGFLPVAYDNLSTGHRSSVRWGPLVEGDILDTERLAQALREHDPAAVIHFAASAYVGESVEDPAKYYRNNVGGTQSVLDACRAAPAFDRSGEGGGRRGEAAHGEGEGGGSRREEAVR